MEEMQLPITCPLCGQKNDFPLATLVPGSIITCPKCKVRLTLHGHMWEDVQQDIDRLKKKKESQK